LSLQILLRFKGTDRSRSNRPQDNAGVATDPPVKGDKRGNADDGKVDRLPQSKLEKFLSGSRGRFRDVNLRNHLSGGKHIAQGGIELLHGNIAYTFRTSRANPCAQGGKG